MALLLRLRAVWSGAGVTGSGLSTFYFQDPATGMSTDVKAAFEAIKSALPPSVTVTIPSSGDIIEDTTGALSGSWAEPGTGGTVVGTNASTFAAGVGYRVKWRTGGIFKGRRVVGSTFVVPIGVNGYDSSGTITEVTRAAHEAIWNTLQADQAEMAVWSRPDLSTPGESNLITAAEIPDKVSWLRSRRT